MSRSEPHLEDSRRQKCPSTDCQEQGSRDEYDDDDGKTDPFLEPGRHASHLATGRFSRLLQICNNERTRVLPPPYFPRQVVWQETAITETAEELGVKG